MTYGFEEHSKDPCLEIGARHVMSGATSQHLSHPHPPFSPHRGRAHQRVILIGPIVFTIFQTIPNVLLWILIVQEIIRSTPNAGVGVVFALLACIPWVFHVVWFEIVAYMQEVTGLSSGLHHPWSTIVFVTVTPRFASEDTGMRGTANNASKACLTGFSTHPAMSSIRGPVLVLATTYPPGVLPRPYVSISASSHVRLHQLCSTDLLPHQLEAPLPSAS
ncbi:hypothetical protein CPB85DRAFT_1485300 [Mucidula mucida]|nr:hypothetical protein CPB85DRAFT_1485300 [Mucidula mucida]